MPRRTRGLKEDRSSSMRSSVDGKHFASRSFHPAPPGNLSPLCQLPGSSPGASVTNASSRALFAFAHAIIAPVLPLVPLVLTKLAPVLPLVPLVLNKLAAVVAFPEAGGKASARRNSIRDSFSVLVPEVAGSRRWAERAVVPDVFTAPLFTPPEPAAEADNPAVTASQRFKSMQERTLSLIIKAGDEVADMAPEDVVKCAKASLHTSRRGSHIGIPNIKAMSLHTLSESGPVTYRKKNKFGARVASFSVAVLVAVFAYYGLRLAFATAADLFALAATAGFMISSAVFVKYQYSWHAELDPLAPGSPSGRRISLVTRCAPKPLDPLLPRDTFTRVPAYCM